ncbi:hypothetical protein TIFTF001_012830 [Ficus carica]|uniref:Negative regulator of systemic acquired resistance SNI1 n=1 Tax=Ficus carica TaxID=3494 RepID=A0AA88DI54_FICCA|nr:hypothetical protein TIFTF001_012830 [Ficus carica]
MLSFAVPFGPSPNSPAKLPFAIQYTLLTEFPGKIKGRKSSSSSHCELKLKLGFFSPQKVGALIERRRLKMYGSRKAKDRGAEEENILAIIDASGDKDTRDAHEDGIAFLEAVRAVSILSDDGIPPTHKMCLEVFKILRIAKSLELIMASYQLLDELDKTFPRVHLSNVDKSQSDNATPELVVVKEAWLPFVVTLELSSSQREADEGKGGPIDSYGFQLLIQDLVNVAEETKSQQSDTKSLRSMLLFQYLVSVLESDFGPRNCAIERTVNWTILRESLLNMLLISAAFSDDLTRLDNSVGQLDNDSDNAVTIALLEVAKNTCNAMQKFLTMIMELDTSKKKAEMEGCTTRADGVRTPMVELILDELTYNRDILHPFLQAYAEPKWKLEVVVQYLWKYIAKPSVRTRRSNGSADDTTFGGTLKCFTNITSTRSTTKKIGAEVTQLLLVHGFQVIVIALCPVTYEPP